MCSPPGTSATLPSVNACSLVVNGEPVPKARARKGKQGKWYTPAPTAEYQQRVQTAWLVEGRPNLGDAPLCATAEFVFARPASQVCKDGSPRASAATYPPTDVDNLAKGVLDALNGLAYTDDRQVVTLTVSKRYAAQAEEPHTALTLTAPSRL